MSTKKQIETVRTVLKKLNDLLAYDYARGYFHQEADIQFSVVRHLYAALSNVDDRWFVGTEHTLSCGKKPDVLCYFLPEKYCDFISNKENYLVAVIEIKYFTSPVADFKKLTAIQKSQKCLVWSIFANHFNSSIHKSNAIQHDKYEIKANAWIKEAPNKRGATILKCGQILSTNQFEPYANRIEALHDFFWLHDQK